MTENERKPRVRRVTVSSHVPLHLADALDESAQSRGKTLSAYIADVLTTHEWGESAVVS